METYLLDWANLLLRWLHVIVAIAWIGSSFYFVFLDSSLTPPEDEQLKKDGVSGELWAVHGGGFYHPVKFNVSPPKLPDHLHWFYWESYSTWLSGFALFLVSYLWSPNVYLIDPKVFEWSAPAAIATALGFLVVFWLLYDAICRTLGQKENGDAKVGALVLVLVCVAAWLATQLFAGRAAFLLMGAMIATAMSANVFFWIIPGQRTVVADLKAGRPVDPIHGKRGKQRSVHNTYFTLPVLFMMTSNHYPLTYGHKHAWLVLAVISLAGVLIREFFVRRHKGRESWGLPAAAVVILIALALVLAPKSTGSGAAGSATFGKVAPIIHERCAGCHADKPTFAGFEQAPGGVKLDTPERIRAAAPRIQQQSVTTQAMPIGNLTRMTPEERALVGKWIADGAKLD